MHSNWRHMNFNIAFRQKSLQNIRTAKNCKNRKRALREAEKHKKWKLKWNFYARRMSNGSIHLTTIKLHSFLWILNHSSASSGLGWGVGVEAICSPIHTSKQNYTFQQFYFFAALMLSLVMLLQTFDGWKEAEFFSPQKFFLRHVEVNFREWKMWKCWNIKSFSSSASEQTLETLNEFLFSLGCLFVFLGRPSMLF